MRKSLSNLILMLLIELGDGILDSKLGKALEDRYRNNKPNVKVKKESKSNEEK